jgi:GTP-binding protein
MWFVDEAQITVRAGDGGRGCAARAQPPYTRHPYPDGGNGGHGGDVVVLADPHLATLLDFRYRHEFAAGRGGHGGSNKKTGQRGEDCMIRVPVGTVIRDAETNALLRDLARSTERVVVATGGRGGLGNATLARRRDPKAGAGALGSAAQALPGEPGRHRRLALELKLIADVGIVGFPNAGKSSLLSRLSTAHPKIGAYPFTTLYPVLGVVEAAGCGPFVTCDVPGLIEGAHAGRGLGTQFLRHIERTRLLIHLVDLAAEDGRDPIAAVHQLNEELSRYSPVLAAKPQVLAANKLDLAAARKRLAGFRHALKRPVLAISCVTGEGLPELVRTVWQRLQNLGRPAGAAAQA